MALFQIAGGVYAWLADEPRLGRPNAGVVIDDDGATVVDALMTPAQAAPFADAVDRLGPPVKRIVHTSGHIEFCGGNSAFPLAAVYGRKATSVHLDQEPNVEAYQRFFASDAQEFVDLETRPVTHVVEEAAMLTPAIEVIPAAGYTPGDLLVHVPAAGVVFTGGLCSVGTTPLGFQGHPAAWASALDFLRQLDPVVVPGHGPVTDRGDVGDLQAYLRAVAEAATGGRPIPPGPWDQWADRDLDDINLERAAMIARGEHGIPPTMARVIGR